MLVHPSHCRACGSYLKIDISPRKTIIVAHAAVVSRRWFLSETEEDEAALLRIMNRLDPEDTGGIDYVEWSNRMRLDNLAEVTS